MSEMEKVQTVIENIQNKINNNDEKEIFDSINQIAINVKKLMSEANLFYKISIVCFQHIFSFYD